MVAIRPCRIRFGGNSACVMNHSAAVELIQADTSSHQLPLFISAALVFQKWSKTMNKLWCWLCCTSKTFWRGGGCWGVGLLPGKGGHHDKLILKSEIDMNIFFEKWHYGGMLDWRWMWVHSMMDMMQTLPTLLQWPTTVLQHQNLQRTKTAFSPQITT